MPPIYPDLEWYSAQSERKALPGRCPYAGIQVCPRYFESIALLSDAGIISRIPKETHDRALEMWRTHELAPSTAETAASISGGKTPNCYSSFCPEVAYDTFKLFGSTLTRINDDPIDRQTAEQWIKEGPAPPGKDWRWNWSHIEPLHFSNCALYAKLYREKPTSSIAFYGPVTGNIAVAGQSITTSVMSLSVAELLIKIDASDATEPQKEAAKFKLGEFLAHPVVAAIIGGLAGNVGG